MNVPPRRPHAARLRRRLRRVRDRLAVRSRGARRRRPEAGRPHRARPDRRRGELGLPAVRARAAAAGHRRRRGDVVAAPAMKTRGLVGLAVVAAALGAVLLIDARRGRGRRRARGGTRAPAAAFDRKTVQRITIRRRGRRAVLAGARSVAGRARARARLARRARRTRRPPTMPAIEELLAALDLAESDRVGRRLGRTRPGCSRPRSQVDIEAAGRRALGAARDGRTRRGRASTRAPARTVPFASWAAACSSWRIATPAAFRDRRLFPLDPDGGDVDRLARRGRRGRAAHRRRALAERAQGVGRRRPRRRGAAAPVRAAHRSLRRPRPAVTRASPRTLTMAAGATRIALAAGDRRRGRRDHRAAASTCTCRRTRSRRPRAPLSAAAARDTRLVAMPPDTVTRIDLFDDHGRVGLRRVDGAWTFSTPKVPYAADTRVVDEWLARLGAIRTATRADGPARASPDPRRPLSAGDRRVRAARRLRAARP